VRGPSSFTDLRTVDGQELSFREACLARGLLENDQHLHLAIEEAGVSQSAPNLRSLMAVILTTCIPSNPRTLWQQFRDLLSEDYLFRHRRNVNNPEAGYNEDIYNNALCSLEDKVIMMGGHQLSSYDLPVPERGTEERLSREYFREVDYDQGQLVTETDNLQQQLTNDQREVYNKFLELVEQGSITNGNRSSNMIFLDAPGGTGKSFVINTILKKIRSGGKIVLATASSGIAATLLQGGRTLHSTFKIPLDTHLKEQPTCSIKRGTALAKVIMDAVAIITDEAPMTHKSAYEAVDRTLQDIRGVRQPMGGIPTLLCGDFRQILPVVKRGTRANIVNASLKTSYLWHSVTVKHLTTNMRAQLSGDGGATNFTKLLLEIGDGQIPIAEEPDTIRIPPGLGKVVSTLGELKAEVYPNLATNGVRPEWLAESAILSPLNTNVNQLNNCLMEEFPGDERIYKSVDSAICDEEAVTYPVELLNSLELSGMPPHLLKLKSGAPIMILRNLEPPKTTNGTRCIITRLHANVIEATISCGPYKGEVVLLPRIPLIPSDSELQFQFRRLQFPCKPCFAMTINKAQGQTLKAIGVDLSVQCFSHGQLYVAVSRTGSAEKLTILAPNSHTRNVVYPEALEH
jgi:ATP-dependent DNA helicase PIF1